VSGEEEGYLNSNERQKQGPVKEGNDNRASMHLAYMKWGHKLRREARHRRTLLTGEGNFSGGGAVHRGSRGTMPVLKRKKEVAPLYYKGERVGTSSSNLSVSEKQYA